MNSLYKKMNMINDEESLDQTKSESLNESFDDYYDEEFEERAQEFYERANEEIEKHFNCTGAFLEPSTQMGRGGVFLFADDMSFEGTFDFETGEEYIYNNDFDGFLQLVLNSFKPVVDENLEEGIFDGKAKKEAAYKEIIDNVFKNSEFPNPAASFGNVVRDCLSDWMDSLSSNDTVDERSGNASTYATTFVKQAMMLLKKLSKPTRDTVLEIIRFVRGLKFNNGEERPQSFDNLSEFYKLYINVLGKEKDGFKVQGYLAPMMCNSVKMPLEACIRQLESKHLIKK